jgi:FkbM family methyltransferase
MNLFNKAKLAAKKAIGRAPSINVQIKVPHTVYGSTYGGWPVINESLNADGIVYSFGLGEDISFDIDIIKKFNCQVYGFDPTPRVHEWLSKQSLPSQLHIHPWGIAAQDGTIKLYPPKNPAHVSHAISGSDTSRTDFIDVPSKRFSSIQQQLGHKTIAILKMDIEGFEYDVIDDLLTLGNLPKQILIEFHHLMYSISMETTMQAIKKMNKAGYSIFYISETGREFGFVKE